MNRRPLRRAAALTLSLLLTLALTLSTAAAERASGAEATDGVHFPKAAWRLPQIVPETEVDPNSATAEAAQARKALNIQSACYDSFIHGDKGAAHQKYIVLHDTEEELAEEERLRVRRAKNREKSRLYYARKRQQSAEAAQAAGV